MTAAKDFADFKGACLRWQRQFGLTDWQLIFEHTPGAGDDSLSTVCCDNDARVAKLVYRHRGIRRMTMGEIAKHEMLHVLLNDFAKMVAVRADDMHKDAIREEHRVIERLMAVVK